jgi:hypothetical protein
MRLLTMSVEDMLSYFEQLERQSKAIKEDMLRMCWYMRGSLSYEDAMLLSNEDRNTIGKIVKDNLETAKKSGMPFF